MRKKQGYAELILGLCGAAISLTLGNPWAVIPLVAYGVLSAVMIRRDDNVKPTENERDCIRKRNITALVCWVVFAAMCYFTFRATTIGVGGMWFMLSTYLFLVAHGIMFIAPANAYGNERNGN